MRLGDVTQFPATPEVVATAKSKTDAIIEAIGKVIPLYQQQKIFNAQLKIAKQNAAQTGGMIDVSQLQPPGIPVSVGLGSQTNTMLLMGLGAIALVLLLKRR